MPGSNDLAHPGPSASACWSGFLLRTLSQHAWTSNAFKRPAAKPSNHIPKERNSTPPLDLHSRAMEAALRHLPPWHSGLGFQVFGLGASGFRVAFDEDGWKQGVRCRGFVLKGLKALRGL